MLTFEHANRDCTGSQLTVDMKPSDGIEDGKFTFSITKQSALGSFEADGSRVLPEFDGDETEISLNAKQAMHLLFVLEGRFDGVNGGKGLFEGGGGRSAVLHCDRVREGASGFGFHIIMRTGGASRDGRILLNPTEAATLARAMNASLGRVAFGD